MSQTGGCSRHTSLNRSHRYTRGPFWRTSFEQMCCCGNKEERYAAYRLEAALGPCCQTLLVLVQTKQAEWQGREESTTTTL